MFQKKKINLQTSYQTINQKLWHQKSKLQLEKQENVILKSQIIRQSKKNTSRARDQIEINFQNLLQKIKHQEQWIKSTNQIIEERSYQALKRQSQTIQIKLKRITLKTKKMEKKLDKIKKDSDVNKFEGKIMNKAFQQQNQYIQSLSKERRELQILLSFKVKCSNEIVNINKEFNQEIINMLSYKNQLKQKLFERQRKKLLKQNKIQRPSSKVFRDNFNVLKPKAVQR